ncbi:MAG: hypothetical protein HGA42_21085 [Nostocales cyanobacterium W4_Combined_metabat2_030]|nr:hypothetical protein [Nostocales cyanobacterium W4_Combined_metabat2_030]
MTKFQRTMCWLMLLLSIYFTGLVLCQNKAQCEYSGKEDKKLTTSLVEPYNELYEVIFEDTKGLIARLSIEKGFDVNTAVNIAQCESQYGLYKENWEGSSAKGIFMFTDKTWKYYCSGDVMNDFDNINCFLKLYEKNKSWWKCEA